LPINISVKLRTKSVTWDEMRMRKRMNGNKTRSRMSTGRMKMGRSTGRMKMGGRKMRTSLHTTPMLDRSPPVQTSRMEARPMTDSSPPHTLHKNTTS